MMPDSFEMANSVCGDGFSVISENGLPEDPKSESSHLEEPHAGLDDSGVDSGGSRGEDEVDCAWDNQQKNPLMPPRGQNPAAAPRNEFSTRKTAAFAMMDVALMMANISQLRVLLVEGRQTQFHVPLTCLVISSIVCQIIFAMLIIVIWIRETRNCGRRDCRLRATDGATDGATEAETLDRRRSKLSTCSAPAVYSLVPGTSHSLRRRRSREPCLDGPWDEFEDAEDDVTIQNLHCVTVMLVFLITIINMFITGLGLEPTPAFLREHAPSRPTGQITEDFSR